MKPRRIVLSRKAGFDLQAVSHALNGLPAHSVARPGPSSSCRGRPLGGAAGPLVLLGRPEADPRIPAPP